MSHALHPTRRPELTWPWIAFLEIPLLASLAALVVLGRVPAAFGIEWECAGCRRAAVVLTPAWFALLVLWSVVTAAAIGPRLALPERGHGGT